MQISARRTRLNVHEDDRRPPQAADIEAQLRFAALLNATRTTDDAGAQRNAAAPPLPAPAPAPVPLPLPLPATRYGTGQASLAAHDTRTAHLVPEHGELTVRLTNGAFAGIEVSVWRCGPDLRARVRSGADSRLRALALAHATLAQTLSVQLGFSVTIELDDDAAPTA